MINGIDVKKYLNYVFENMGTEPIDNLLPYSENIKDKLKRGSSPAGGNWRIKK